MGKDQAFGIIVFIACLMLAVGFVTSVVAPQVVQIILPWLPWSAAQIQFWAVATIVLIAFLAVMFIGAWIGWTMATTPPPKQLEELETSKISKEEKD